MLSSKNAMQSLAAMDLGLGDALHNQLEDSEEERRKQQQQAMLAKHFTGMGGALGPGTMALYGSAVGGV